MFKSYKVGSRLGPIEVVDSCYTELLPEAYNLFRWKSSLHHNISTVGGVYKYFIATGKIHCIATVLI